MRGLPLAIALGAALAACNPSTTSGGASGDGAKPAVASGSMSSAAGPGSSPLSTSPGPGARDASAGGVLLVEASQDTDALSLVRTKRLEAKSAGRVLVVYVGATWCEPCKKFKTEVQSGRLDARLGKLTLLAFDADKDADRLGAAGYTYKFVPCVALPGADGRPADVQEATGRGGQAWRELLGKLDAWQRGS